MPRTRVYGAIQKLNDRQLLEFAALMSLCTRYGSSFEWQEAYKEVTGEKYDD